MADSEIRGTPEENRFVGGLGEQIRNRDLLCIRCANLRRDAVAECGVYSQKPLAVLSGEMRCPEFAPRKRRLLFWKRTK